ncbi:hypothetical protein PanWU01x14_104580 [Parasponia andersonii]|uniref:Uncharacterized protein n=1 Tax=Parasponia andersonii TaxID=3476 RepID=A0A2P5D1X8_PARAD|nr:hypothetical protein PanWU01x14_104580 [Parasponia andersonii]
MDLRDDQYGARPPLHKLVKSWSHSLDEPKIRRNQLMLPIYVLLVSKLAQRVRHRTRCVHVEGVTLTKNGIRAKAADVCEAHCCIP